MVKYFQRVAQGCKKRDTLGTMLINIRPGIVISIQLQLLESCIPLKLDQISNSLGKIARHLLDLLLGMPDTV